MVVKTIEGYVKPFKKGEILIINRPNISDVTFIVRVKEKIQIDANSYSTLRCKVLNDEHNFTINLNVEANILLRTYTNDVKKVREQNPEFFI